MSDTPRTDDAEVYYSEIVTGREGGLYWVKADFTRQLERELSEKRIEDMSKAELLSLQGRVQAELRYHESDEPKCSDSR